MKRQFCLGALLIAFALARLASPFLSAAQQAAGPIPTSPGQTVFGQHCASCHENPATADRAPDLKTLMKLAPETVYAAVTTGSMAVPAQKLTDEEKRAVA